MYDSADAGWWLQPPKKSKAMLMLVNGDHHLTEMTEIVWTNAPQLLVVQGGGVFGGGLCQSCGFFSEVHRLTPQLAEPGQLPERTGARHSSPASIVRKLTGPATGTSFDWTAAKVENWDAGFLVISYVVVRSLSRALAFTALCF